MNHFARRVELRITAQEIKWTRQGFKSASLLVLKNLQTFYLNLLPCFQLQFVIILIGIMNSTQTFEFLNSFNPIAARCIS
jgi:hypothetical protein